jgi:membrane associated rhomboid family serine protease
MERLLERLDRRLGKYAIPNLMAFVVVGMGIVWVLSMQRPEVQSRIWLDFHAVRRGELWRLITFVLMPIPGLDMMMLINLYFLWWVGASLEQHWGAFKFNVYYFTGVVACIVAAYFTGAASSTWLNNASPMLAFATLFPDVEILLFFIVPIKVKWLGVVTAMVVVVFFIQGGPMTRASIEASLVSYVLFFAAHWRDVLKGRQLQVRQRARRAELEAAAPVFGQRVCAICGAKEAEGTDIRVCSCEKCGGKPRALCLEHARNH